MARRLRRWKPSTPRARAEVLGGTWRQHVGRQLSQCTVGIIGCGYVGKDLAVLLRAFGCRVLAHDILDFADFYAEHDIEPAALEDLLKNSDVVTLHLPIDDSTRNILSTERLACMRPDAILINAARGGLVDEDAPKKPSWPWDAPPSAASMKTNCPRKASSRKVTERCFPA